MVRYVSAPKRPPTARKRANPSRRAAQYEQATVLVVEDDPTLLTTLAYNLLREGYRVLTAADGEPVWRWRGKSWRGWIWWCST